MNGAASDHTDGPRNRPALSALRSANTHNRSTMAADALTAIRDAIIFGDIPPGAPLRLEHVADSLGMSASPVREAIRQLENLGLAESIPYRGSRVTSLDLDEMRDIYDLRLAVETVSGRWAAERLTTEHESRLEDVLRSSTSPTTREISAARSKETQSFTPCSQWPRNRSGPSERYVPCSKPPNATARSCSARSTASSR